MQGHLTAREPVVRDDSGIQLPPAYSEGYRTLIPILSGQPSDFGRTGFRFKSDSDSRLNAAFPPPGLGLDTLRKAPDKETTVRRCGNVR